MARMVDSYPQETTVYVNGNPIHVTYVVQNGEVSIVSAEGGTVTVQLDGEDIREAVSLDDIEIAKEMVEKEVEQGIEHEEEVVQEQIEEEQQATEELEKVKEVRQDAILEQPEKSEEARVEQEEKIEAAVEQAEEQKQGVLEQQEKMEDIRVEQEEKVAEVVTQEDERKEIVVEEQERRETITLEQEEKTEEAVKQDYVKHPFPEYQTVDEIVDRIDESHFEKHVLGYDKKSDKSFEENKEFEQERFGEKLDVQTFEDYQQHASDTLTDPDTKFFVGEKGNNENALFAYNEETNTYIVVPVDESHSATMYRPEEGMKKFEKANKWEINNTTNELPEIHEGIQNIYPELDQEQAQQEALAPEVQQQEVSEEQKIEEEKETQTEATTIEQSSAEPEQEQEKDHLSQINDKYDSMLENRLNDLNENVKKGYVDEDEVEDEKEKVNEAIERARQEAIKAEMRAASQSTCQHVGTYSQQRYWRKCFRHEEYDFM